MSFFHRHKGLTPYLLLIPGIVWLVLFFLAPLGFLGYQSLQSGTFDTGYTFDWAFSNYWDALSDYHTQFIRSFVYAGIATVLALAVSDLASGLDFKLQSASAIDVGTRGAGGMRYLSATYLVRNAQFCGNPGTCAPYGQPRQNLTFLGVITSTSVPSGRVTPPSPSGSRTGAPSGTPSPAAPAVLAGAVLLPRYAGGRIHPRPCAHRPADHEPPGGDGAGGCAGA